ncbi:MAG TPA: hypothetical protein VHG29_07675 [Novosphingobium sp.]|nr:hypothetical protein [Novosphingobium sp.]
MRTAAISALALACALPAAPLLAQSVSDFRLPPASPTPTPRAPGPVDSDNPVVTAPRPTPTPAPAPTVTQNPTPAPAASAQPTLTRTPTARPSAAPRGTTPASDVAATPALPTADAAITPAPLTFPTSSSVAPLPQSTAPAAREGSGAMLPLLGGGALLLAALGGLVWWRRRAAEREPEIDFEPPVVARPEPEASEPAVATVGPPLLAPQRAPTPADTVLAMALEATRLSATLLNTTLQYRLRLTNHTAAPLGPITVSGDMVAAHATLPVEQQLGLSGLTLERRHETPVLAPGESVTLSGEIRLPLAAITPIRAGGAALFIPLARFRAEAPGLAVVHNFVVGEAPEVADAALRPFRLDLGPRVYSRIGQRELALPA